MADRIFASRCGARAVELLASDIHGCRVIGIKDNKIIDLDAEEALAIPNKFDQELYRISTMLSK